MHDDRKKPGVAFWATVVIVVVLIGYPVSFGPACWLSSRFTRGADLLPLVYRPITWIMERGSSEFKIAMRSYSRSLDVDGWDWERRAIIPADGIACIEDVQFEWRFKHCWNKLTPWIDRQPRQARDSADQSRVEGI
jgi:hypothetical protein